MKKNVKDKKENKKQLILVILGLIGIVATTVGVSLSFFRYTKEGSTDNTITTGTITFLYTEITGQGRGILLEDALPIENEKGKILTGERNVFDFNITSSTTPDVEIPYIVTARMSDSSNLDPSIVDLYLTDKLSNNVFLDVTRYSDLPKYNNLNNERIIYSGIVPNSSYNNSYNQDFKLRMWVDETTDYSASKNNDGSFKLDENGNYVYPHNDQKFKITVNVYANGQAISSQGQQTQTIYAGTNKGGYRQLGSQINLENYQTGYTKNDVGQAYLKYDVDSTGKITSVQGCLAASANAGEICLYSEGNNIYEINKQLVLDYFGLDNSTIASKCPIFNDSEVLCEDDKVRLAFNDGPGIWIVNKENSKTCLTQFDFGIYDCK